MPVKVYVQNKTFYVDVRLSGGLGLPPVELIRNQFVVRPPMWDRNSNSSALGVVNEKGFPVLHVIYRTSSTIAINGVFWYPDGVLLVTDTEAVTDPAPGERFSLKPIFKYPSWKFPGELQ